MAHDVFISYSYKDKAVADAVCNGLENNKLRCWIAPRDITPGENWAESITNAIPKSKILVLIFSSNSNLSKQVIREVGLAISNDVILLPFRIEDVVPTGGMSYYLSTVHWIDAINDTLESKVSTLCHTINSIMHGHDPKDDKNDFDNNTHSNKKNYNPIKKNRKKKIQFSISISLAVTAFVVCFFIFKDMIFKTDNTLSPTTNTPKVSDESTPEPTAKPTQTSTEQPTTKPTNTPDIDLEMVVDIPDDTLRSGILSTLEIMGEKIDSTITVGDMLKLKRLVIVTPYVYECIYDQIGPMVNREDEYIIINEDNITTLEGLQYAYNLEILAIGDKGVSDISQLSELVNLQMLFLHGNNITDISAVSNLINLYYLELGSNSNINDISALKKLTKLEELDLSDSGKITDISVLSNLTNLKRLWWRSHGLRDIGSLSTLTKLDTLDISYNNITDISVLAGLTKLRTLFMISNDISDITPLEGLKRLETIHCHNNYIDNISVLENINNLRELTLDSDIYDKNLDIVNRLVDSGCTVDRKLE